MVGKRPSESSICRWSLSESKSVACACVVVFDGLQRPACSLQPGEPGADQLGAFELPGPLLMANGGQTLKNVQTTLAFFGSGGG